MPVPAAITTAMTRIAQSETARDIAKTALTATAEKVTQKVLQRLDGGQPEARANGSVGQGAMIPRRNTLPGAIPAAAPDASADLPAVGHGFGQGFGRRA
jgi:hypothetical protein